MGGCISEFNFGPTSPPENDTVMMSIVLLSTVESKMEEVVHVHSAV